jgi:aspartyl-tRNA(Asn)/glutamyl-tRNA(Gln) amidotransferase subunit C
MVTHDEVRKIAALSKLYFDEAQLDSITEDLNGVLAFADAVTAFDASGYDIDSGEDMLLPLREDIVTPSYESELILGNAMEADDGFFVVRDRQL